MVSLSNDHSVNTVNTKVNMSAKKLLNGIEDCVDEGLNALVAINPSLSLVKNHRVIVRSDVEKVKGKVALLCGGGSGHGEYSYQLNLGQISTTTRNAFSSVEPAFSGYVGRGCLSAAVAGSVFASPPPTAILAALMTLASINPSGILVVSPWNIVNFILAFDDKLLLNRSCTTILVTG